MATYTVGGANFVTEDDTHDHDRRWLQKPP